MISKTIGCRGTNHFQTNPPGVLRNHQILWEDLTKIFKAKTLEIRYNMWHLPYDLFLCKNGWKTRKWTYTWSFCLSNKHLGLRWIQFSWLRGTSILRLELHEPPPLALIVELITSTSLIHVTHRWCMMWRCVRGIIPTQNCNFSQVGEFSSNSARFFQAFKSYGIW